jgi:hypothetical protein
MSATQLRRYTAALVVIAEVLLADVKAARAGGTQ